MSLDVDKVYTKVLALNAIYNSVVDTTLYQIS
jgi:hypothetical protein